MTLSEFAYKGKRKVLRSVCFFLFQYPRILKYKILSTCSFVTGSPYLYQPVLFEGLGRVQFSHGVSLGVNQSIGFYIGYIYIDVRCPSSKIDFGSNIWVNNNCSFISEGEGIYIGDNTLIGTNCEFFDSDFHDLDPEKRLGGVIKTGKIHVGKNVFIGSNVTVLKGVSIGENTVISNGSIVTRDIPSNVVAAGIPAKVIRPL